MEIITVRLFINKFTLASGAGSSSPIYEYPVDSYHTDPVVLKSYNILRAACDKLSDGSSL